MLARIEKIIGPDDVGTVIGLIVVAALIAGSTFMMAVFWLRQTGFA